jgi:hypothetical protein
MPTITRSFFTAASFRARRPPTSESTRRPHRDFRDPIVAQEQLDEDE